MNDEQKSVTVKLWQYDSVSGKNLTKNGSDGKCTRMFKERDQLECHVLRWRSRWCTVVILKTRKTYLVCHSANKTRRHAVSESRVEWTVHSYLYLWFAFRLAVLRPILSDSQHSHVSTFNNHCLCDSSELDFDLQFVSLSLKQCFTNFFHPYTFICLRNYSKHHSGLHLSYCSPVWQVQHYI